MWMCFQPVIWQKHVKTMGWDVDWTAFVFDFKQGLTMQSCLSWGTL